MRKSLFACFFFLCCVVAVMVVQTLVMQAEAGSPTYQSETSSSRGILDKLKYYLFLPRTKIQLFIRHLRGRYKAPEEPQPDISDVLAGLVTQRDYVKYLVFVISAPNKRSVRDVIRTKGYWNYNWTDMDTGEPIQWKHFFVVGQNSDETVNAAVREEAEDHPDMLIGGFEDSYKNLVFKTLWLIEWAVNMYDFDTMIKCDDDTIINMSKYDQLIKKQDLSLPFYGGVRFGAMPVFRKGRYEVSKEVWEPDKFPPYCSGGGYTLNRQAIMKLLEAHYSGVQQVFLVEDAFIGVLAFHAKLEVKQLVPLFVPWYPHEHCHETEVTLLHYVLPRYQVEYMEYFRATGRFCDERFVLDHHGIPK